MGYRPPDAGQFPPEPRDDETKRVAEEYSKRSRVGRLTTWLVALVLMAGVAYVIVQYALHLL